MTIDNSYERQLIVAAATGDEKFIMSHLYRGGDPDLTIQGKPTPLSYCVMNKNVPLVSQCLHFGANPNHQCKAGNSPCIYAVLCRSAECLKLLLEQGADVALTNRQQQVATDLCRGSDLVSIEMRRILCADCLERKTLFLN